MTGIREFLRKINDKPSCMTRVNWQVETEGFKYRRLRSIIMGINETEVCQLAREYIFNAWCYKMKEPSDKIVRMLDRCFEERNAKVLERLHKQELDKKARNLDKTTFYEDEDRVNEPFVCDNLFSQHYYHEYHRLQEENIRLKAELEKYENKARHIMNQARMEGIRTLVEQLIIYAEREDKKVAREIKFALNTKMVNSHIPSNVLTTEWKQRLEDLGRDKPRRNDTMTFNNQVGTVVAHADHVILQYKENE